MSVSKQMKILCVKLGIDISELGRISGKSSHKDDRPLMDFIADRVLESENEIMRLLHITFPKLP